MPSPNTADLPRPKDWNEFEDIVADVMKRVWGDPYISRNGRSGQRQHGIDIYGKPVHLHGKDYAGVQCRAIEDKLTIAAVEAVVADAEKFTPAIKELLLATTLSRDAKLQALVRTGKWPFRVEIRYWDDLCLDLCGHEDLLEKHFPGFMKKRTTMADIERLIMSTEPSDFKMEETGCYVCQKDIQLRIIHLINLEDDERGFDEKWVHRYPNPSATRETVHIKYGDAVVKEMTFILTDGARYFIPLPKSASELTITKFQFKVAAVLNPTRDLYRGLSDGGISISDTGADAEE